MTPIPCQVVALRQETADVVTLRTISTAGPFPAFRAGQFHMVTAFGVGEAAVSISSAPDETEWIEHTVRDVGPVTHALIATPIGEVIGVRGPFGTDWGIEADRVGDVVVVAGGIGIAPLRGAVYQLLRRSRHGRVVVIVGARSPSQIVFQRDLEAWSGLGARVEVTVDVFEPGWDGHVGLVTSQLEGADFDPPNASALVCGPEIMMRFTAAALADSGIRPDRIRVSLERNMQCGVGWCGHCQLGPLLLCRDGPVVPYEGLVAHLLRERER
jgi:anaerobic sulfite reductase subunit B